MVLTFIVPPRSNSIVPSTVTPWTPFGPIVPLPRRSVPASTMRLPLTMPFVANVNVPAPALRKLPLPAMNPA